MTNHIYDKIKKELVIECERLLQEDKHKTEKAEGFDKVDAMSQHFQGSDAFYRLLIDKLNAVLISNDVLLEDENEKAEFQEFIKPILQSYMTKYLSN